MKLPLQVRYWQICPEWDIQACPYIVDADGHLICSMSQNVEHPGLFDSEAVQNANRIVAALNNMV